MVAGHLVWVVGGEYVCGVLGCGFWVVVRVAWELWVVGRRLLSSFGQAGLCLLVLCCEVVWCVGADCHLGLVVE